VMQNSFHKFRSGKVWILKKVDTAHVSVLVWVR
jgi:hypothetical protein